MKGYCDVCGKDDLIETEIALLVVLVRGCSQHRSYRAIRKPRALCGKCELLYSVAQDLRRKGTI